MEWWQILAAIGASGIFGGAVATWLRTRPAMKIAQTQGEMPLWARIEKLEAIVADLQHDLANETWNFDLFLAQAELNPEKISELIPRIREDRMRHKERMAKKRGVREGQSIAAAAGGDLG